MKIIHLADIHWRGLSRHDEYQESFSMFFEKARELNPDVIYVGGDIVHNKRQGISPELIDRLCWWFNGLSDIAPTHIILGNHDGLVLNKDRQDAISPIIDALQNDNLFLYKDSGTYPVKDHEEFNWCVFSCFDEGRWKSVIPDKDKINIALFHGAVWGSKTDIDWSIDGDVTDDFFNDFDFALLGDIHKRQFLNDAKTMAYPGSTIQQNYGETTGKGFLFWDIRSLDDFDVEFHEIPHMKPFITLDWNGSVDNIISESLNHPDGSRFRIRSKTALMQADSKRLQYDLRREKSATEVVFKSEASFDVSKIQTAGGSLSKENLREPNTHKKLIREFYRDSDIADKQYQKLDRLVEKYTSRISDDNEVLRNSRWQVNSLRFDNLFAYGDGNIVNFENLPGITGIFGKNTKGKSSIIGSLMYGLFNTTDRGSIKNLHIINNRKNDCNATIDLSLNGENLRVSRSTIKHQTRKGDVYASTSLQLHKILSDGTISEDITEEQRRVTENVLRRMIGTSEDFLMTSLASQGEMNTFIKEGASSRKMILTKFLDLGVFEKMYDAAKEDSSEIRNKAKTYPDIDWDEEIDNFQFNVNESSGELKKIEREISNKRKTLRDLNIQLATSDNPDIVTKHEIEARQRIIKDSQAEIFEMISARDSIQKKIFSNDEKIQKINLVKLDFPINELLEKRESQSAIERSLVDLKHVYENQKKELERLEASISKLNEVPCGDSFPTCKFIKDSHEDKDRILNQRDETKKSLKSLKSAKSALSSILRESIDEKIEKYDSLVTKESEISLDTSSLQIDLNNCENLLSSSEADLLKLKDELLDMIPRLVESEENPSAVIRASIVSLEDDIKKLDRKRLRKFENIISLNAEISRMKSDRKEFDTIKQDLIAYDFFMQATSKKGIPLQIMMSQLPLINSEISKILQGVTGFTVDLEADPESNSMDIYINYGDSRRIIELASGMEKMMASLAIRVALINVSSLTKTNMLIIDEGFGALDETNIEACSRLLESLKKWFRNIIVISHVDAIKDAVDNSLEITKNEKDTKVYSA